jgi:hypothetical protein
LRPVALLPELPNTPCEGELDLDEGGFIGRQLEKLAGISYLPSSGFELSSLITVHV